MEDRLIVFYNFTDLNSNMDRIQLVDPNGVLIIKKDLNSNMDRIQYKGIKSNFRGLCNLNSNMDRIQYYDILGYRPIIDI